MVIFAASLPSPRVRYTLLALTLAGSAAGGATWWSRRPVAVECATVARGTLLRTVVSSGQVAAPRQTTLGPEVGGRVVSVGVDEGAHVAEGDVLVQLDDTSARAEVDEARAAVSEAEARLSRLRRTGARVALATEARARADAEQAQLRFARVEALVGGGVLPAEQLDDARRQRDATAAGLAEAEAGAEAASAGGGDVRLTVAGLRRTQAALRSAERRVEQATLRAPAAGTVLRRDVEQGAVVQAGQALFEFVADGAPRLEVNPDESHLAYIAVGQAALASVEARPDETFAATVRHVAPSVDPTRGTVKVELSIDDPVPRNLLPGMTASVEVTLARLDNVLILPTEAVRDAGGPDPYVLVIDGERIARRSVTLGLRAGELYEVRSGVEAGMRVALAPTSEALEALTEGTHVRVVEVR